METLVSPIRGATVAIPAAKRRTERRALRALGVIVSIVGKSVDDDTEGDEQLGQCFEEKKSYFRLFPPGGSVLWHWITLVIELVTPANHSCLFMNIISASSGARAELGIHKVNTRPPCCRSPCCHVEQAWCWSVHTQCQ